MTSPVRAGDVLAGKYRVERVLGVGGMGVVVAATHLQLEQLVALKFMLPQVLSNPEAVARFLREAKAVVRLKGEHVARVQDVGTLENGAPYIVMEYLEGDDLAGTLEKRGALPVSEACEYILQACEAMAEAHALGIVHRDLKPQNMFLTRRPDGRACVKVLDFGISKTQSVQATQTSAIMGSPAYMSPEQMKSSRDVDARADVWALGVILYQLVSARLPFNAPTMPELCVKVLTDEPEPLQIASQLPPALTSAIGRCLRKEREHRYPNVAALVADLAAFVPRGGAETLERVTRLLGITAPTIAPPASATPTPQMGNAGFATTLGSSAGHSMPATAERPKRRWLLPVAGLAVVAIGVITFAALRDPSDSSGTTATPAATPSPPPPPPVAVTPDAAIADAAPPPVVTHVPEVDAGVAERPKPIVVGKQAGKTRLQVREQPADKQHPAVTTVKPPDPIVKPPDPTPVKPPDPTPKKDPFSTRN